MSRYSVLNPDQCFRILVKEGSLEKTAVYLFENGVVNPKTGQPFTRQAIHLAVRRSPKYAEYIASKIHLAEDGREILARISEN